MFYTEIVVKNNTCIGGEIVNTVQRGGGIVVKIPFFSAKKNKLKLNKIEAGKITANIKKQKLNLWQNDSVIPSDKILTRNYLLLRFDNSCWILKKEHLSKNRLIFQIILRNGEMVLQFNFNLKLY